jgi:hypothetical protein
MESVILEELVTVVCRISTSSEKISPSKNAAEEKEAA